jgi:hypothetical protein
MHAMILTLDQEIIKDIYGDERINGIDGSWYLCVLE